MALSNWDTLAVDLKGRPVAGHFESPLGVKVAIYKNWLYVRDPKAWRAGLFCEPTVMEIQNGELSYLDVRIVAKRGPQEGVYAAIYSRTGDAVAGIVGCGVYGFDDDKWIGVQASSVAFLKEMIGVRSEFDGHKFYELPDEVATVDLSGATRFNQGDKYFADYAGVDTPATQPGQSGEPVFTKIIENMK